MKSTQRSPLRAPQDLEPKVAYLARARHSGRHAANTAVIDLPAVIRQRLPWSDQVQREPLPVPPSQLQLAPRDRSANFGAKASSPLPARHPRSPISENVWLIESREIREIDGEIDDDDLPSDQEGTDDWESPSLQRLRRKAVMLLGFTTRRSHS